jgi:hypothetical protein
MGWLLLGVCFVLLGIVLLDLFYLGGIHWMAGMRCFYYLFEGRKLEVYFKLVGWLINIINGIIVIVINEIKY